MKRILSIFVHIVMTAALIFFTCQSQAKTGNNSDNNKTAMMVAGGIVVGGGLIGAIFALSGNNGSSSNPAPASAPAPSSSDKAITAYSLNIEGATTEINGQTITVTVPRSTDLTSQPFIATFTTTGASVALGSAVQTSGVTPVTFPSDTYSLTYTVTAADGSTVDYTVKVAAKLYTVTYDANGGDIGNTANASYASGSSFNLPPSTGFTHSGGLSFNGWSYNGFLYAADASLNMPDQNITISATWGGY